MGRRNTILFEESSVIKGGEGFNPTFNLFCYNDKRTKSDDYTFVVYIMGEISCFFERYTLEGKSYSDFIKFVEEVKNEEILELQTLNDEQKENVLEKLKLMRFLVNIFGGEPWR